MDKRTRFASLEGMRGIAAIGVVMMHGDKLFGAAAPPSGYLAVDFFFLLSGFIMAHAYAGRLESGLSGLAFLRARLVRLYPLYLAGTLSTVVYAVAAMLIRHEHGLWSYTEPPVSLPFALFMLPSPAADVLYPLDIPAWTLALELVANAAFAIAWLRSRRALMALVAGSGVVLAVSVADLGTMNIGWDFRTLLPGLARVLFSFPLGVLLYRVRWRIRLPAWFSLAPVLALGALLYVNPQGDARALFDLAFVAAASPLLLLAAAASHPRSRALGGAFLFLGLISYPLYALHHPSLIAFQGLILRHVSAGPLLGVASAVLLLGLVVAAWVAAIADKRLGRLLNARLRAAGRAVPGAAERRRAPS